MFVNGQQMSSQLNPIICPRKLSPSFSYRRYEKAEVLNSIIHNILDEVHTATSSNILSKILMIWVEDFVAFFLASPFINTFIFFEMLLFLVVRCCCNSKLFRAIVDGPVRTGNLDAMDYLTTKLGTANMKFSISSEL